MSTTKDFKLIVIGASYGGINALKDLLPQLCSLTDLPLVVVQHMKLDEKKLFVNHLNQLCSHKVKEAVDNDPIKDKHIYIAPADYHLLIEPSFELSLSKDDPVSYSRPSIDVLFESASDTYQSRLIGILLTGSNHDGANGIVTIKENDGITIAQDPNTAVMPTMPQSAIDTGKVDHILNLDAIPELLTSILKEDQSDGGKK